MREIYTILQSRPQRERHHTTRACTTYTSTLPQINRERTTSLRKTKKKHIRERKEKEKTPQASSRGIKEHKALRK